MHFYCTVVYCVCACVCVCINNVLQLVLSFFPRLLLKSTRLSLSGHSFFPGFYPIVFKEKGLVAHPHQLGGSTVCREHGSNKNGGVGGVKEGLWQCIIHRWSECVNQRGWHISAGWAARARGRVPDPDSNKHYNENKYGPNHSFSSLLLLTLSHFIFCSSDELGMRHLPPHPRPRTQLLLGTYYPKHLLQCCVESDVLATISVRKETNIFRQRSDSWFKRWSVFRTSLWFLFFFPWSLWLRKDFLFP